MDERLVASAIKTMRAHNTPHFEIIHCPGKSDADVEKIQTAAKRSHPLQEVHFIHIMEQTDELLDVAQ
jgi:hypothetical protein